MAGAAPKDYKNASILSNFEPVALWPRHLCSIMDGSSGGERSNMNRHIWLTISFTLVSSVWMGRSVNAAEDRIGRAAVVRNDVSQIEPKIIRISPGDLIFHDEVVRTASDSDAKFVLEDDTNLSLGPGSTLKLDKAVFSGAKNAGDISIKLTKGAFRFITGHSPKESYAINTPLATIGVRGTTLDFLIEDTKNTVVLQKGEAEICTNGRCVQLMRGGQAAVITASNGTTDINLLDSPPWTFASASSCGGSLCVQTTFAAAGSAPGSSGSGVGVGGGTGGLSPPGTGGNSGGLEHIGSSSNGVPTNSQSSFTGGGTTSASQSAGQSTSPSH